MPRRFFRKFSIKRHQLSESWLFAPFRNLVHEPRIWGIRRRTVVPAFALGLFIAFLPFPGHAVMALLAALTLRINAAVAAITTFVSNPLTIGPMYYAAYELGRRLLGTPKMDIDFELSFAWVTQTFVHIWQPMTAGCLLLGTTAALLGYVIVDILWRLSVHDYKSSKRRQRHDKRSV